MRRRPRSSPVPPPASAARRRRAWSPTAGGSSGIDRTDTAPDGVDLVIGDCGDTAILEAATGARRRFAGCARLLRRYPADRPVGEPRALGRGHSRRPDRRLRGAARLLAGARRGARLGRAGGEHRRRGRGLAALPRLCGREGRTGGPRPLDGRHRRTGGRPRQRRRSRRHRHRLRRAPAPRRPSNRRSARTHGNSRGGRRGHRLPCRTDATYVTGEIWTIDGGRTVLSTADC